jgi:menaquinone-dependent protoporphyrinogen oxidase
VALFALGPVKNPRDEKEWQGSKEQLDKELSNYPWLKPISKMLFGGKFDPKLLRFPLNKMAGSEPASDIRDWKAIRSWAESVIEKLK